MPGNYNRASYKKVVDNIEHTVVDKSYCNNNVSNLVVHHDWFLHFWTMVMADLGAAVGYPLYQEEGGLKLIQNHLPS